MLCMELDKRNRKWQDTYSEEREMIQKQRRKDMACLEVKVVSGSGYNCIFQNFKLF